MMAKIPRNLEQLRLIKVEANVSTYARADNRSYQTKFSTNRLNGIAIGSAFTTHISRDTPPFSTSHSCCLNHLSR